MNRFLLAAPLGALGLTLVATGILFYQGRRKPNQSGEYVALGSSYAAGLGLGPRQPGSPFVSMRSTNGYPHLLARMTGLSLVDMSSSGSTTEHILHGGQIFLGAQIAAIGSATRLVTITSGGNDVGYIGDLASASGGSLRRLLLKIFVRNQDRDFVRFKENLKQIVRVAQERAPNARVVIVTYPTVLPSHGTCDALGVDEHVADRSRTVADRLHEATVQAAEESGAILVDMVRASAGHDVCSEEPWVNGGNPRIGAPFHPNALGAAATAQAIFQHISELI